ncbi:hypothetical protein NFI96_010274 [Prochilodus magdalenae]|nr:hypothetical protein NFI96_010274 [Prochilodus magdalenae]
MHFARASSERSMEEQQQEEELEVAVIELLECPLCMEPLDVTAKVLPCQHTFCKPCLLRLEASPSSFSSSPHMCCPECHAPLSGRVENLPTNLLLSRLLEGLQRQRLTTPRGRSGVCMSSTAQEGSVVEEVIQPAQQQRGQGSQEVLAKALYNYQANGSGELTMKSGDIVSLRYKVDENWCYGDAKGSSGLVPTKMVQVLSDQVQPVALCRALYDFDLNRLDPEDRKECLPFLKGDLISVIKRVDENWCEGRVRDRVGIFPLQFTELTAAAAPSSAAAAAARASCLSVKADQREGAKHQSVTNGIVLLPYLNFTPDSGTRKPNPAALKILGRGSTASRPEETRRSSGRRRISGPTRPPQVSLLNSLNNRPSYSHIQSQRSGPPAPPAPGKTTLLNPASKPRSGNAHRSLTKVERKMNSEVPPTITMALINPQALPPPPESKLSSTQQLSISVCAALYSYSPHRPEELELRKGEMVGVYGKFKEGWLRGLSLRTGKVGILPANYVTPVLRTSARFLEQPKPAAPIANIAVSTKRYTPQKPVVLALDKVKTDGNSAAPIIAMPPQSAVSSGGAVRAPQAGGKPGWDTVRRAFQPSHRV